ncbi:MAG: hypothetical protein LBP75_01550 [Planctomycetota bacterium]|jgi:hypothetical protein|nr:hypothetical protein [Planctomycetota bacterium]
MRNTSFGDEQFRGTTSDAIQRMYANAFQILCDYHLKTFDDVMNGFDLNEYTPWKTEIFDIILEQYDAIILNHDRVPKRRLIINPFTIGADRINYVPMVHRRIYKETIKKLSIGDKTTINYSCIFPYRLLYFSDRFETYENNRGGTSKLIPLDFFQMLFLLKPALISGLTWLLPSRFVNTDTDSSVIVGAFEYRTANNVYSIE